MNLLSATDSCLDISRPKPYIRKMQTVSLVTVGCKLNQYETQLLSENFELNGFRVLPWGQNADVIIINTCSITSRAEATARNFIYRSARLTPKPYLAITGCYARRKKNGLQQIKGVDLVGNDQELLNALTDHSDRKDVISSFDGHTRAFVKIQDGCSNFCTFCVLPYLRGRPQSRSCHEILEEVSELCAGGYLEIVLTGINIANYEDNGVDLVGLLGKFEEVRSVKRLRLSSIEPTYIGERFFEYLSRSKKLCAHLHIPLQSGDVTILRRMRRRYTAKDYSSLVWQLKKTMPQIALGADVIVGFPGEGEEEFQSTLSLVEKLPLSYLHVFRYSPREETPAIHFDHKVPEDLKKRRCAQLMSLGRHKWLEFRQGFIGAELEVLIEHRREVKSGKLVGMSSNYIKVLLDGDDHLMGKIATVELERNLDKYSYGRIVAI